MTRKFLVGCVLWTCVVKEAYNYYYCSMICKEIDIPARSCSYKTPEEAWEDCESFMLKMGAKPLKEKQVWSITTQFQKIVNLILKQLRRGAWCNRNEGV